MRKVTVRDEAGKTMATIEVMRSGRYVGLDVKDKGIEHGGVAMSLDSDEVAQLISALALTHAEVIAQS